MKILITTGIFKPEVGGPATYAAELARRLKATGHPVSVITYSDKLRFTLDGEYPFPIIRVQRHPNKLINYFRYFLTVWNHAKDYDVIYSLDWFSAGVPVMIAAFLRGKKYVVRVGGAYIWEKYLSQNRPPLTLRSFYEKEIYKEYKLMYFLIRLVLRQAVHVIFNSDEQRVLYERYYKLPLSKTSVIYNPIPGNKLSALVQSYKQSNFDRDKEIVFAGRFIRMKNVESLIQAFAKFNNPQYRLLLIGEGPTEMELRKLVELHNLTSQVTFMPPMSQQELYRRISNCAYVVLPSWTDVSPNQIYECLALRIPFLVTQENFLAINKYEFLKIDPSSVEDIAEKMTWLSDPEHYEEFTQSLSKIKFDYSWNNVVVDHMKLFNHL